MSNVLVTGGNGFLGQNMVSYLTDLGHNVRAFNRYNSPQLQSEEGKHEIIYGDIRDKEAVDKAVKNIDIVIHLVSNFRKGGTDKMNAHDINVVGTQNVLNASYNNNVKQFIHCSTIGVHGNISHIPANEDSPFNPGDLYQETKLLAEKYVWDFYKEKNLPTTVIRPISMFGPGDMRMLKLFKLIKKRCLLMIGDGEVYFQPAYIDDVVQGFGLCINNKQAVGEVFIVGGDEYITLNQLVTMIANELSVSPPKWRIPMKPAVKIATLCENIFVPIGIEPPLHRRRISFFKNNRAFSVEKAKKILGYQPQVSLLLGIQRTIKWYQDHGWLKSNVIYNNDKQL